MRSQVKLNVVALATLVVVASSTFSSTGPVHADSAPPVPGPSNPITVSADALPTVQINGVVWSQVAVGNTVWVAGSFTRARPAGSPLGSNEVTRNNLLAYDIRTGVLIDYPINPDLNAVAHEITASPDGSKIYVGGEFTQAGGQTRNRVAAFSTATGALLNFNPNVSGPVYAVAATNSTVYLGGSFSAVGTTSRTRLAAVDGTTGAVIPAWQPVPGAGPGGSDIVARPRRHQQQPGGGRGQVRHDER